MKVLTLILLCWAFKVYIAEVEPESYQFDQESMCDLRRNDSPSYTKDWFTSGGMVTAFCGSLAFLWDKPLPGTKWCGPGNIAENPEDLGIFKQTDSCCRAHDNCDDWIQANETKYNLTNPRTLTSVLCSCDIRFRKCLKKVISLPERVFAWAVGWGYFNYFHQQCFNKSHPATCSRYYKNTIFGKRCKKYKFDKKKPKLYQWFDSPMW